MAGGRTAPGLGALNPIRSYDERGGLPSIPIECVGEDALGYLWCGSQGGIRRYNGHEWTPVPLPEGNRSNWVCSLCPARDGGMWFGTNGNGLHHLKDGVWTSYTVRTGFPAGWVTSLTETRDAQGRSELWIGTWKEGLWRLASGNLTRIPGPEPGSPATITSLLAARDGGLWCGTPRGVLRYGKGAGAFPWAGGAELPGSEITCLAETQEGGQSVLWAGTKKGLERRQDGTWRTFGPEQGLPSPAVSALGVQRGTDGGTILWVGTDRGLGILKGGTFSAMAQRNGLPSNIVCSIHVDDRPGSPPMVWIGTFAGMGRYMPRKWSRFDPAQGVGQQAVFSIREDTDHSIWFGTAGGGILHLDQGRWSSVDQVEGHSITTVLSLCLGRDALYAGTRDSGVMVRRGGRWRPWEHNGELPQTSVFALLESLDPQGRPVLWVGTRGGLVRSGPEGLRTFALGSGLPHDHVVALLETRDEDGGSILWVGTRGGGVARFRRGTWEAFGEAQGLPEGRVSALALIPDEEGRPFIWVATHSNGVARFDPAHPERPWLFFSEADQAKLPSPNVVSLGRDPGGHIYLFTHEGVVRLTPKGNGQFTFQTHTQGDGLPSNTCTQGSSLVDSFGRVWTGTTAGVAVQETADPVEDTRPKPLLFERCLDLAGGTVLRDGAVLGHRQNRLRFEFSLLSFFKESASRFRVQMEGLDAAPGPWKADPAQEYTALPDGNYTFKVWAMDHAGNLSGPIALSFRIRPAFWRHPLAYLVYAGLALGAGWALSRLRIRVLRSRNIRLQAKIQEATAALVDREAQVKLQADRLVRTNAKLRLLHEQKNRFLGIAAHDLRNPLSGIVLAAEFILEEGRAGLAQAELERIIDQARSMADLVGRFLDVTALESGWVKMDLEVCELSALADARAQEFQQRAQAKGIDLRTERSGPGPRVQCDPKFMNQILDNLLSNAIKFSPRDRSVRVRVEDTGPTGRISVVDEGPGLTPEDLTKIFGWFSRLSAKPTGGETSTGMGLSIVKNMVDAMGGTIRVESLPGEGATFIVELPKA